MKAIIRLTKIFRKVTKFTSWIFAREGKNEDYPRWGLSLLQLFNRSICILFKVRKYIARTVYCFMITNLLFCHQV